MFSRWRKVWSGLLVALGAGVASAQSTPPPLQLIVPFPPGGHTDLVARMLAPRLSEKLSQPVVVHNRPGAGGNLGHDAVARAAPDGNTLVLTGTSLVSNPVLLKAASVDPLRQLAPVTQLSSHSLLLLTNPGSGPRSLADLDSAMRRGALNCAQVGGMTTFGCEWLRSVTQAPMVMVPYKGSAPAMSDLVSGRIHFLFDQVASAQPQIRAGLVRAVATTAGQRSAPLQDVPALSEKFPGFTLVGWLGVLAPAGTPAATVERLNAAFVKVLAEPEIRARFEEHQLSVAATSAAEFGRILEQDVRKYAHLAQLTGISPE